MADHGALDDDGVIWVLGGMLDEMRTTLRFTTPGAVALKGFAIDDEQYEVRLTRRAKDD